MPPLHEIGEARSFAGGVSVRVIRAGWFRPDAGGFFGVVPKPLWSRFVETDDRGRILCRLNLLLIEAGGKRILVETGTGVRMNDKDRDIKGVEGGDPTEALRAVGEDPASIDFVVLTHLHYDHARSSRTLATSCSGTMPKRRTATSCACRASWRSNSSTRSVPPRSWPR
jgi:hypothetical protein